MTVAVAILLSVGVLAFFTNVAFFGTVVHITKVLTHAFALVLAGLTLVGVSRVFAKWRVNKQESNAKMDKSQH